MNPVGSIITRRLQYALTLAVVTLGGACAGDDPVEPPPVDSRWLLLELYDRTDGPGWIHSENWGTDAPLDSWYGVTTDSRGNVVGLDLRANGLAGEIPWRLHALVHVESLDLRDNRLRGSIPPELGYLESLVSLQLGSNRLHGPIPLQFGYLQDLVVLDLRDNVLIHTIPGELEGLQNLERLALTSNELRGAIPGELGHLPNLRHLWLEDNDLTGTIPDDFRHLQSLGTLRVNSNPLDDRLPVDLFLLPLEGFWWNETSLCAPDDPIFQEWLWAIPDHRPGIGCD